MAAAAFLARWLPNVGRVDIVTTGITVAVIAAVGISGVTYRSVVDRTRDFAVRLALGSQPGWLVRLVIAEALRDLAIGAAAGLAGGMAAAAFLARWLPNVGRVDVLTMAITVSLIAAVGLVAAIVPAVRVTRVDPAQALHG
jgi:ABC-type antimicrobial peptide transport system permease subunit